MGKRGVTKLKEPAKKILKHKLTYELLSIIILPKAAGVGTRIIKLVAPVFMPTIVKKIEKKVESKNTAKDPQAKQDEEKND